MARDSTTPEFESLVLDQSRDVVPVGGAAEIREALVCMLGQVRHRFDVFSYQLDPALLDDAEVIDSLRAKLIDRRRVRARFLAHDLAPVVGQGHRLIETARRLSTFIEIRTLAPEHREHVFACILADAGGIIYRKHADTFDGTVCFNDPRRADELGRQFEEMWGHATPDANVRALNI